MRKKNQRRQWGNILERENGNGEVTSLLARYQSPFGPGRITKSFPPTDAGWKKAAEWLEDELAYLERCEREHKPWNSPKQREALRAKSRVTFGEFVEQWLEDYRTKSGEELSGSSKWNIRADVGHLLPRFENMAIQAIMPEDIKGWYDSPHPEGPYAFHRTCQRFKAIMKAASTEGLDGSAPLRPDNPFIFPIPPVPDSGRSKVPPLTAEELQAIYEAMPDYTRLSVYLSALAGGLRIGEVCALQVRDIDLRNKLLTVRHSVNRGETDRGEAQLAKPKTDSSKRTVILPNELVPLVEAHIRRYCGDDAEAMLFRPKHAKIMSQNTLRKQFNEARGKAGRDDVTFHALRATHATLLILSGGTLREAMNQLGHTSTEVAIKHYQRAVDEHTKMAANTLAERMLPVARTPEVVAADYAAALRQLKEAKERLTALRQEMRSLAGR